MVREVPGNALFFTTYEVAQMAFPRWVQMEQVPTAATSSAQGSGSGWVSSSGGGGGGGGGGAGERPAEQRGRAEVERAFWLQETLAAVLCGIACQILPTTSSSTC